MWLSYLPWLQLPDCGARSQLYPEQATTAPPQDSFSLYLPDGVTEVAAERTEGPGLTELLYSECSPKRGLQVGAALSPNPLPDPDDCSPQAWLTTMLDLSFGQLVLLSVALSSLQESRETRLPQTENRHKCEKSE